jgi:hypothetical protein
MDDWFFSDEQGGWSGHIAHIDRRCYPNSIGRGVHIWGSKAVDGEPRVIAGESLGNVRFY